MHLRVRLAAVLMAALVCLPAGAPAAEAVAVPELPPADQAAAADLIATQLRAAIDGVRVDAGLQPFTSYWPASTVATSWAQEMASGGALAHNGSVAAELGVAVGDVLENVGHLWPVGSVDGSADRMLSVFMASPRHRANLLSRHSHIGIGVVIQGESLWVTAIMLTPDRGRPVHYRR